MPEANQQPVSESDGKFVAINHVFPAGHRSAFANHFVIQQNQAGEFKLSFFELDEPLILARTPEERQEKLDELTSVNAVCVATVVMTKARMAQVLKAIAENITKTLVLPKEPVEPKASEG